MRGRSPGDVAGMSTGTGPGRAQAAARRKVLQFGVDRAAVELIPGRRRLVVVTDSVAARRGALPARARRQRRTESERNAPLRAAGRAERRLQSGTGTAEVVLGRTEHGCRHRRSRTRRRRPERVKVGRSERVHCRDQAGTGRAPRPLVRIGEEGLPVLGRRDRTTSASADGRNLDTR